MGKWSEKQLLILTVALVAVVVSGLAFLVVMARRAVTEVESEIKQAQNEKKSQEQRVRDMDKLQADIAAKTENFERFKRQLPAGEELAALVEAIGKMADRARVQKGAFFFAPDAAPPPTGGQGPPFRSYTIRLPVKGNFQQIGSFINEIERHKRFMRVDSFDLSTPTSGATAASMVSPGPLECSSNITVKTFTYEQGKGK